MKTTDNKCESYSKSFSTEETSPPNNSWWINITSVDLVENHFLKWKLRKLKQNSQYNHTIHNSCEKNFSTKGNFFTYNFSALCRKASLMNTNKHNIYENACNVLLEKCAQSSHVYDKRLFKKIFNNIMRITLLGFVKVWVVWFCINL